MHQTLTNILKSIFFPGDIHNNIDSRAFVAECRNERTLNASRTDTIKVRLLAVECSEQNKYKLME